MKPHPKPARLFNKAPKKVSGAITTLTSSKETKQFTKELLKVLTKEKE